MKRITLVTGNKGKLKEWQELLPDDLDVVSRDIDLPEIQSLDIYEVVTDKAKRAFEVVKGPVFVEDMSAGLDDLAGLPGTFYKFFDKELGNTALLRLSKAATNKVTCICLAAYYDGKNMIFGEGVTKGIVVEPRGADSFGFAPVVVPNGETETFAEMTSEKRNKVSHRAKAVRSLVDQL